VVKTWKYKGPLEFRTCRARIGTIPARDGYKAKPSSIVQLYCTVPNCQERHPEELS